MLAMRYCRFAGILICIMFAYTAFSQKRGSSQPIKGNCSKPGMTTPHLPSDTEKVEITLRRTSCFGSCPSYSILIRGDGSVLYEGKGFVKQLGQHRTRISAAQVRALAERFFSEGFFSFCGTYGAPSDLPSAITSIKWPGVRKTVINYGGFAGPIPQELFELEETIDNFVDSHQWVGDGVIPHAEDVPPPSPKLSPQ